MVQRSTSEDSPLQITVLIGKKVFDQVLPKVPFSFFA